MSNIFHSTEHSGTETWREANSLPYSGLSKKLPAKLQFSKQLKNQYAQRKKL